MSKSTDVFDLSGQAAVITGGASGLGLGMARALGEAGAAMVVPPGESGALAQALSTLLDDPARREQLASCARAAAAGTYSWERAAEQTLALYRELVG